MREQHAADVPAVDPLAAPGGSTSRDPCRRSRSGRRRRPRRTPWPASDGASATRCRRAARAARRPRAGRGDQPGAMPPPAAAPGPGPPESAFRRTRAPRRRPRDPLPTRRVDAHALLHRFGLTWRAENWHEPCQKSTGRQAGRHGATHGRRNTARLRVRALLLHRQARGLSALQGDPARAPRHDVAPLPGHGAARHGCRTDAGGRAARRPLDDRHHADHRLVRDDVAGAAGGAGRSGAGVREPPSGGLRRRMAVAARDALPLELRSRRAARERSPGRRGAGRRAGAALGAALRDPSPPVPPVRARRRRDAEHEGARGGRLPARARRAADRRRDAPVPPRRRSHPRRLRVLRSDVPALRIRPDARSHHARARAGGGRMGAAGVDRARRRRRARDSWPASPTTGARCSTTSGRHISPTCAPTPKRGGPVGAASTSRLGDVAYQGLPTSRYRVWCLERLQRHAGALPAPAREAVHARLARHGCWEPLWRVDTPSSGHDPEHRAPFGRGIPVFE